MISRARSQGSRSWRNWPRMLENPNPTMESPYGILRFFSRCLKPPGAPDPPPIPRVSCTAPPATAPGLPACLRYRLRRVVTHTLDLRNVMARGRDLWRIPSDKTYKKPWKITIKSEINYFDWAMGHVQVRFLYDICMYTISMFNSFHFQFHSVQ